MKYLGIRPKDHLLSRAFFYAIPNETRFWRPRMADKQNPKPPRHLKAPTKRWWKSVVDGYALEPHHVRLLTVAVEACDRCQQSREALQEHGLTYMDRFEQPRSRPEVAIERDSRRPHTLRGPSCPETEPTPRPVCEGIPGLSRVRSREIWTTW